MSPEEIPLIINCHGSPQIGILHKPSNSKNTAVVVVVAGGPQYRVGCARQLILWSRRLAEDGYPVLRFDYRGFGDSGGEFKGFEHIDDDIRSAIDQLQQQVPNIDDIVLWAECNAASAVMMYAWQDSRVKRLIMQNPWVRNEATQARTYIKHYYLMRIMQKSFWLKLATFRFNPLTALSSLLDLWRTSMQAEQNSNRIKDRDFDDLETYQEKMREGLARFKGKVLLFMSGYSLIGKEFDELVNLSERWQAILNNLDLTRIDEPDADHTFSRAIDREKLIDNALRWLNGDVRNA
ncbi:hydrolase 1, exosortase A system-associated [Methylocaldum sp. 14B]|uniref:hydrolase 1, exosortase A system-associated n=1 Tax=Methylocaldum sp. 14B TaxID=1912213 RepID=UPI00098AC0F6|nr:hydrolase 1, exosortase A system-associated [Methylocaldum sp. 14B]